MRPRLHLQHDKTCAPADGKSSLRCTCGNLLARVVAEGVEIKCRRCKRHVVVPFDEKETMRINM